MLSPASFQEAVAQLRARPDIVAVRVPRAVYREYARQMADLWRYQFVRRDEEWGVPVLRVGRQGIAAEGTPWPLVRRALGRT